MAMNVAETRTVNLHEANRLVRRAMKRKRPVMIWGAPGIGKSDLIATLARMLGRQLIDIRLPLWEPTDIKGMPYYNATTGKMEWSIPAEFPTDP